MRWNLKAVLFGLGTYGLLWLAATPAQAGKKSTLTLRAPHAKGPTRLVLQADRLHYRPARGRIQLEGKVSLQVDSMKLTAARVTVLLTPGGRPSRIEARGRVQITRGPSHGSSRQATLELGRKALRLVLAGEPRLRWAPLGITLQGQRIEVDLRSGRLTVHKARACMERSQARSGKAAGRRFVGAADSCHASAPTKGDHGTRRD